MASAPIDRVTKRQPYWLLVVAAVPFVQALLKAVSSYLTSRIQNGKADWGDVIFIFFDWLVLAFFAPLIYILARRYPLRRKGIGRAIAAHLLGALAFTVIWTSVGVFLGWLLSRFPGEGNLLRGYVTWLIITLPWSLFLYLLMLGSVCAFTYYHEAREHESQQARLAAQLAQARLGALRMQLNPHFLFNSLNAITVLVNDGNTQDAAQMLELLGEVLRQVLKTRPGHEVTLNEELEFI